MKSLYSFTFVLCCLIGWSALAEDRGTKREAGKMESKPTRLIQLSDAKRPGAIVPENLAENFYVGRFSNEKLSYFTPTQKQIDELENGLISFVEKKKPDGGGNLAERLKKERSRYRAQYVGVVVDAKKLLYANYFFVHQEEYVKDWLNRLIFVKDGGNSYFQVEYDTDKHECLSLNVNGEG
jgi:hypothetical protein